METLKEIAILLLSGASVRDGCETFTLKEFRVIDGLFKAVLTSHGYFYTNYELAETKENAIYQALIGVQAMGRFLRNPTEETIHASEKVKIKKEKSTPKPVVKSVANPEPQPQIRDDVPEESTQAEQSQEIISDDPSRSPEDIERMTILRIVTRANQT